MTNASGNRHVRVKLDYAEQKEEAVMLDLTLDGNDKVVGAWEVHGRWIEYEGNALKTYPMILKRDGVIDFGPGHSSYSSNIRDKAVKENEYCTFWSDDERGQAGGTEWTYRVRSVAILGDVR